MSLLSVHSQAHSLNISPQPKQCQHRNAGSTTQCREKKNKETLKFWIGPSLVLDYNIQYSALYSTLFWSSLYLTCLVTFNLLYPLPKVWTQSNLGGKKPKKTGKSTEIVHTVKSNFIKVWLHWNCILKKNGERKKISLPALMSLENCSSVAKRPAKGKYFGCICGLKRGNCI